MLSVGFSSVLLVSALFTQFVTEGAEPGPKWGYTAKLGPSHWCEIFPESHCCGNMQSPIDIDHRYSNIQVLPLPRLQMTHYDIPLRDLNVTNNGHTVILKPTRSKFLPTLSGGPLKGTYMFDNLHFHWGSTSKQGSEHMMDGRRYPIEMHVVHINSKYPSEDIAREYHDGFAIFSVLFKLTRNDNRKYRGIIRALTKVTYKDESILVDPPLHLGSLLPRVVDNYVAYFGSETSPPCTQTIMWLVFRKPVCMGSKQINAFRNLRRETAEDDPDYTKALVNNYRPLQRMDNRMLFQADPYYH